MNLKIGADIGGTFTDLIPIDDSGINLRLDILHSFPTLF
jgi:N-methylhydantoinase A/oxoprolinase/acetone carboxylase beta subunit